MLVSQRLALAATLLASCSSISHREDVAALVATVDTQELHASVQALDAIGPRTVSDVAATRATVDHLAATLAGYGWEVEETTFPMKFGGEVIATLRPLGEPTAEAIEVPVEPELVRTGPRAMAGRSEAFRAEGYQLESFHAGGRDEELVVDVPNLFAIKPGRHPESGVVELSAHYDTVPHSPGANDNSSGVAALLEVARVLQDVELDQTVRLCFFGAEEVGLSGSRAHLAANHARFDPPVTALLNLDSVGYAISGAGTQRLMDGIPTLVRWWLAFPDEADFLVFAGHADSAWLGALVEDVADAYVPELRYYGANRIGHRFRDAHRSDHAHYWAAGIPAVFWTDTGEMRNDFYHTPRDTPEQLNLEFLTAVTRAAVAATVHLADREAR